MGRKANDSGIRAPDTGSKKKFDVNRQLKEKTGRFNYQVGKKERQQLKAGKTDIAPKGDLLVAAAGVFVVAMVVAFLVWYMATAEGETEYEIVEE